MILNKGFSRPYNNILIKSIMNRLNEIKSQKLLDIGKRVYGLSPDELDKRMTEVSTMIKDLSDLDLAKDEDLQLEMMVICSRLMNDNVDESKYFTTEGLVSGVDTSGHDVGDDICCGGHCCGEDHHSCNCIDDPNKGLLSF